MVFWEVSPLSTIELSLRQVERCLWCGHNERSFSCDPTSTTDVGRSPDPSLLAHHHPHLPACHRRVRSVLLQTARSARCRAHSPLSAVPHQREPSVAVHLHPDRLRTPVFLYPHT